MPEQPKSQPSIVTHLERIYTKGAKRGSYYDLLFQEVLALAQHLVDDLHRSGYHQDFIQHAVMRVINTVTVAALEHIEFAEFERAVNQVMTDIFFQTTLHPSRSRTQVYAGAVPSEPEILRQLELEGTIETEQYFYFATQETNGSHVHVHNIEREDELLIADLQRKVTTGTIGLRSLIGSQAIITAMSKLISSIKFAPAVTSRIDLEIDVSAEEITGTPLQGAFCCKYGEQFLKFENVEFEYLKFIFARNNRNEIVIKTVIPSIDIPKHLKTSTQDTLKHVVQKIVDSQNYSKCYDMMSGEEIDLNSQSIAS